MSSMIFGMKVAIVTGSSKGIGSGIAQYLLHKGFKVYIMVLAGNVGVSMMVNVVFLFPEMRIATHNIQRVY